jgi:hypothetical protein
MISSTKVTLTDLVQKEFLERRSAHSIGVRHFLNAYRLACLLQQGLDCASQ